MQKFCRHTVFIGCVLGHSEVHLGLIKPNQYKVVLKEGETDLGDIIQWKSINLYNQLISYI